MEPPRGGDRLSRISRGGAGAPPGRARGGLTGCGRAGRAWGLLTVAALAALVLVASAASAPRHPKSVVAPHRNDRVLVAYKRGLTASARTALKNRVGAWTIRTYLNHSELLRVRPGRVAAVIKALRASGQVRYAEPDYIERESAASVPNDPSFAQQWAFQ